MAYNFLGLVNDVNRRLNEVELTQSNFPTAVGFYSQAKNSVNSAIQDINQSQFEWPFNYVSQTDTLVVGTTRYAFPVAAKSVDMDSFRIKFDSVLDSETQKLKALSYEEYLEKFVDQEYNPDTSQYSQPDFIFRSPGLEYGVVPAPDKAYDIVYDYYAKTTDLASATDVPAVPEIYRHIIIDGAMYYAYMFRSNEQAAALSKNKFEQGIKYMRTILINRYDYLRSTYRPTIRRTSYVYRLSS